MSKSLFREARYREVTNSNDEKQDALILIAFKIVAQLSFNFMIEISASILHRRAVDRTTRG